MRKFGPREMGMQMPCCFHAEISAEGALWEVAAAFGEVFRELARHCIQQQKQEDDRLNQLGLFGGKGRLQRLQDKPVLGGSQFKLPAVLPEVADCCRIWADGRAVGIHALREEAENPTALRTGKFVNRQGIYDSRFAIDAPQKITRLHCGAGVSPVCFQNPVCSNQT